MSECYVIERFIAPGGLQNGLNIAHYLMQSEGCIL